MSACTWCRPSCSKPSLSARLGTTASAKTRCGLAGASRTARVTRHHMPPESDDNYVRQRRRVRPTEDPDSCQHGSSLVVCALLPFIELLAVCRGPRRFCRRCTGWSTERRCRHGPCATAPGSLQDISCGRLGDSDSGSRRCGTKLGRRALER